MSFYFYFFYSEQELHMGLCFLPICNCNSICSYLLQCGEFPPPLLQSELLLTFLTPVKQLVLIRHIEFAAQSGPCAISATIVIHRVWNCNKYKLTAGRILEMEKQAKFVISSTK